ncbi:MAG: hypothetical protein AAGK74_17340, partial [Chloroflexota bacterium]
MDETQTMYDLDVETVDTFAVGDGAWVVHNQDPRNSAGEFLFPTLKQPKAQWQYIQNPTYDAVRPNILRGRLPSWFDTWYVGTYNGQRYRLPKIGN